MPIFTRGNGGAEKSGIPPEVTQLGAQRQGSNQAQEPRLWCMSLNGSLHRHLGVSTAQPSK